MKEEKDILEAETKYKKLLFDKLKDDKRLALSCPEFRYPEPVYFYIKSKKTEKSIAVRIDGEDNTMRFWDYVDDDYSEEDGVWDRMTDRGIEHFIKKLYKVMDNAVDIEFYDKEGLTDDYYSGVGEEELSIEYARQVLKANSEGIKFVFARVTNFYGNIQYIFDRNFECIKKAYRI